MTVPGDVCRDFSRSSRLEWLETNGTGAFAMGTVAGVNTRRYHALLTASLRPPVERYVLLSRVEEEAEGCLLGPCQYPGVKPRGFEFIEEFRTDPCATWRFRVRNAALEKQVYLIGGRQAAVIRYRCDQEMTLRVRPFLAYRDYHSLGVKRDDVWGALPRLQFAHAGRFEDAPDWYYNVEYLEELDRGLDFREDLFSPGTIVLDLKPGEWSPICASIDGASYAEPHFEDDPFLVRRVDAKPTIIAGYPWFTDWGRDTMISLPGLFIGRGKLDTAREIIQGFLAYLDHGVIPNRFPDAGEKPEYNTADATLWMFHAAAKLGMRDAFYPAAKQIVAMHMKKADPADGLLQSAAQYTWMDTRYTPRAGKAVEINALWHAALCQMAEWSSELGDPADYRAEADRVRGSFRGKFWNAERNCLFDLIGDGKLRPNQIFAVSLGRDILEKRQQRAVVCAVHRELLTPVGLRTLDRGDPDYQPRYQGGPEQRDAAYHQGTVWPWLMGPFIEAYLIAFGRNPKNLAYCRELIQRLEEESARAGCHGSIAEIYDGDEPRFPRGCPAQAWSVAEITRAKLLTEEP